MTCGMKSMQNVMNFPLAIPQYLKLTDAHRFFIVGFGFICLVQVRFCWVWLDQLRLSQVTLAQALIIMSSDITNIPPHDFKLPSRYYYWVQEVKYKTWICDLRKSFHTNFHVFQTISSQINMYTRSSHFRSCIL